MFKLLLHWMLMAQQCPGGAECVPIHPPCESVALQTLTVATVPSNRTRIRLGVGEMTLLSIVPTPACTVTWSLSGLGALIPNPDGASASFFAHDRASTPIVTATINGVPFSVVYNVVEPSGITMTREPGTGLKHTFGTSSVGFLGRAWYSPTDVSFDNIQVRELDAVGVGTHYYAVWNGLPHGIGSWEDVSAGTETMGSKDGVLDQIDSGQRNPPFDPNGGTFTWNIPWEFRVATGAGKVFTTVIHQQTVTPSGWTTICKQDPPLAGHCETRLPSDPTSSW